MKNRVLALIFSLILCLGAGVCAFAQDAPSRLVDAADLLDESEEADILATLDEISVRQGMDVVIVTTLTLDGKSPMAYADDFFDYNGYGQGAGYDGVLLLVSMEDRDYYISTTGYGITAFTDAGIEYIGEEVVYYLSDGYYALAFSEFAALCDSFITQANTGEPYDYGNLPSEPYDPIFTLVVSLAVGLVIAFIGVSIMKGKLKSVRKQSGAGNYLKDGSLNITASRERFLYSQTARVARASENSGGSSTHRSSSGRVHGGGGGKF